MAYVETNFMLLTELAAPPQQLQLQSGERKHDKKTKRVKAVILGKNGPEFVILNRRRAIRERCLNCSAWAPTEVRKCAFADCPLYPFRSGKSKQDAKKREKAIRRYCLWCIAGNSKQVAKCTSTTCASFSYRMTTLDRAAQIIEKDDGEVRDSVTT